jgi:hypothetical protein
MSSSEMGERSLGGSRTHAPSPLCLPSQARLRGLFVSHSFTASLLFPIHASRFCGWSRKSGYITRTTSRQLAATDAAPGDPLLVMATGGDDSLPP